MHVYVSCVCLYMCLYSVYMSVYVCMLMWVVGVGVYVWGCMCLWKTEFNFRCHFLGTTFLSCDRTLSWPETCWIGQFVRPGSLRSILSLPSLSWDYKRVPLCCLLLFVLNVFWEWNSIPCAFKVSSSLTELSPLPFWIILNTSE